MAGLDALVIGGVGHDDAGAGLGIEVLLREDGGAFGLGLLEMPQEQRGVGHVEIPARIFLLGLAEHVAIGERDGRVGSLNGISMT